MAENQVMDKATAMGKLGLEEGYTLPELRQAFRRAYTANPSDPEVREAFTVLAADFGEDAATGHATAFNAATVAAAGDAIRSAVGNDKHADCETPAPSNAPAWYAKGRTFLQHFPYRLAFVLAVILSYTTANLTGGQGALEFLGNAVLFLLSFINLCVPFMTNPLRRFLIRGFAALYAKTCENPVQDVPRLGA